MLHNSPPTEAVTHRRMKQCERVENMSAMMEGEIKDQRESNKMKQGNETVDRLRE